MTEEDYKRLKSTFDTLLQVEGQSVGKIRDLLKIGNGTAQYIAQSTSFKDYCEIRDEMLHRTERKLAEEAAQKSAVEKSKQIVASTPSSLELKAMPKPVTTYDLDKMLDKRFEQLRYWLMETYLPVTVDRIKKECVNSNSELLREIKELLAEPDQPGARRHWWDNAPKK